MTDTVENDAGIDRSYGHGNSVQFLLDVYHDTWCLDCPAEKGEKCQYTASDVPSKNQPDEKPRPVVGDPLPFFHYRRRRYHYMLRGERPARVIPPAKGDQ